jgi:phosphatidylinositol alpha-1,6-mannosyltransferase
VALDSKPAPKRVLILGSEFPPGPGGIGTHAHQLAVHLTRQGWQVHVLTPQAYVTDEVRETFNSRQPYSVTTLPERDDDRGWLRRRLELIAETIRTFRPDLMIASGRRALWTAAAVQQRYRVPWVAIGHGSEFLGQSRITQLLTAQAVNRATAVVAVSDYTARLVSQMATPARLVVIPNGADGERFYPMPYDPDLCQELDLSEQRVLLTVGHVSERKAQDVVIRALPAVVAQHPDVVYVMVGLPTRREELQRLADELGVGGYVRFAGSVADDRLPDYYNLADLFVLVSRQAADGDVEGYGIVVQEAALCGKPAVVSQGCGLTEAIEETVTGVSVPPEDPAATAEAINALLADDKRRLAMGRQARELAVQATWSHRVAAYDALLQELS